MNNIYGVITVCVVKQNKYYLNKNSQYSSKDLIISSWLSSKDSIVSPMDKAHSWQPYDEYSLEKEQPDIVFIHNPYDGTNNVTRVPEQYYSYPLPSKCSPGLST